MNPLSYSHSTLSRCFYDIDFYNEKKLLDDEYRANVLKKAVAISDRGFKKDFKLIVRSKGKKKTYSAANISQKIVLRNCVKNLKLYIKGHSKHRNIITKEIKAFLSEGTPYKIYKLDISAFFESVSTDHLLSVLSVTRVSTQTVSLIKSFLDEFNQNYGEGLPRGIEISPILSELILKSFDDVVSTQKEVFYYSRFVDDIIIITSGKESEKDFIKFVRGTLPNGLRLNHNKKKIQSIPKKGPGNNPANIIGEFDFLGYKFSILEPKTMESRSIRLKNEYRHIIISLADSKLKKLKNKISKAFYAFSKDKDFDLLYDRILFLASNRELKNQRTDRLIPTGIYYNYSLLDTESDCISQLDDYYKKMVLSGNGRLRMKYTANLSTIQKKRLLKINFQLGFKVRFYKRFSPNRLRQISQLWQH